MRKEIQTATLLSGGHLLFLVLSALAVGVACIVNFSIRWVPWCNMSEQPFAQASLHTALVVLTVFCVALVASNMIRPRDLWRVAALCGVFFLGIPTLMFFRDYLVANLLVVLSMYNVMRIQDHPGEEKAKVFFASFFVVLAGWFVPAAVAFMAVVYVGVLVFSPSDIRTWLIPLAGVAASYILLVTYEVVWLGGDSFFPELSSRLFAMPYAEKVFKADGFYFYLVCLLLAWGWAYAKYWRFAWGETIPRKKRFFVISAIGLTALVIAVLLLRYKYLVVFFAVPFSVVIARFFAVATASQRTAMRWYLAVVAVLGLLFFK